MSDQEITYLNYAATSFPKSTVALESFYKNVTSPPLGSRHHGLSPFKELKERIGAVLGVDRNYLFFTDSATTGLNQVILGFSQKDYTVAFDNRSHNAVIKPSQTLSKHFLAPIYDKKDCFDEPALMQTLINQPDLFVLTHVSNVNGSIYPIEKIIQLIRTYSPSTAILIDASQSAGAVLLDSLRLADFAVFPAHKHLHSLPGAALLMAKKQLVPRILGGTGNEEGGDKTRPFTEVGTPNLPAIAAMVDSLEYAYAHYDCHRALEDDLTTQFIEGVSQIEGIEVIQGTEKRVSVVALNPRFGSPELHWVPYLQSQHIIVRGGLHCSPVHHAQLNLLQKGSLRISFGWGSKEHHVLKALASLQEFCSVVQEVFI